MDAVICHHCEGQQSPGWQPGQLCQHCGHEVRPETRCAWCCRWTPEGKFCRECGFELLPDHLFGAARMLKGVGVDQLQLAQRTQALEAEQLQDYGARYSQQYAVVIQRVEEVRFLQEHLLLQHYAASLETHLIKQLPLDADQLKRWSQGGSAAGDQEPGARILQIIQHTPLPKVRQLAFFALLKAASPEVVAQHRNFVLQELESYLGESVELSLEMLALVGHWCMWSVEVSGSHVQPGMSAKLLSQALAIHQAGDYLSGDSVVARRVRYTLACVILRCHSDVAIPEDFAQWAHEQLHQLEPGYDTDQRMSLALMQKDAQTLAAQIDYGPSWRSQIGAASLVHMSAYQALLPFIQQGHVAQLRSICEAFLYQERALKPEIQRALLRRLDAQDEALALDVIACLCLKQQILPEVYQQVFQLCQRHRQLSWVLRLIQALPQHDHDVACDLLAELAPRVSAVTPGLSPEFVQQSLRPLAAAHRFSCRLLDVLVDHYAHSGLLRAVDTGLAGQCDEILHEQLAQPINPPRDLGPVLPRLFEFAIQWLQAEALTRLTSRWVSTLLSQYGREINHQLRASSVLSLSFAPLFLQHIEPKSNTGKLDQMAADLLGPEDCWLVEQWCQHLGLNEALLQWIYPLAQAAPLPAATLGAVLSEAKARQQLGHARYKEMLRHQQQLQAPALDAGYRRLLEWCLQSQDTRLQQQAFDLVLSRLTAQGSSLFANWCQLYPSAEQALAALLAALALDLSHPLTHWVISQLIEDEELAEGWQLPILDALLGLYPRSQGLGIQAKLASTTAAVLTSCAQIHPEYLPHWAQRLYAQPEREMAAEPVLPALIDGWCQHDVVGCMAFFIRLLDKAQCAQQTQQDICYHLVIANNRLSSQLISLKAETLLSMLRHLVQAQFRDQRGRSLWQLGKKLWDPLLSQLLAEHLSEFAQAVLSWVQPQDQLSHEQPWQALLGHLRPALATLMVLAKDDAALMQSIQHFMVSGIEAGCQPIDQALAWERYDQEWLEQLLSEFNQADVPFSPEVSDALQSCLQPLDEESALAEWRGLGLLRSMLQSEDGDAPSLMASDDPMLAVAQEMVRESLLAMEQQLDGMLPALAALPEASRSMTLLQLKAGFEPTLALLQPEMAKLSAADQQQAQARIHTIYQRLEPAVDA